MNRKCKKCGRIDYDIWGYFALLGWSLLVGTMGYVISTVFYSPSIVVMGMVFGVIFWLPAYFISLHERKEIRNNAEKK